MPKPLRPKAEEVLRHNLLILVGLPSPMHKKIPDSYSKREGGNPGNSDLSSQQ